MIPDPDNPETDQSKKRWIGVFDLEEVNERLEVRNKGHFSQSEGTPFTVDPLKRLFGRHANTHAARELSKGYVPVHGILEAASAILQHLAENRLPAVDVHISPEDLRSGYVRWREKTTTSPSGLHLGHYKTLAQVKPGSVKYDDGDVKYSISEQIFEIEALRTNIALKYGFVFE
jgi:hypothetical protein